MRLLHRLQDERCVVELVVLAAEADAPRSERLHHDLVGLEVHRLRFRGIDAERGDLERGHAAAHPELEPSAAQAVEGADLLGEAQGMVERQRIHQGPEAKAFGALRREREEDRRRGRHPERRRVVLGDVQSVQADPVVGLGELEPVLEELGERLAARIHVIEDAELHFRDVTS